MPVCVPVRASSRPCRASPYGFTAEGGRPLRRLRRPQPHAYEAELDAAAELEAEEGEQGEEE